MITDPADDDPAFRSAEEWLADRGIRRERIQVATTNPAPDQTPPPAAGEAGEAGEVGSLSDLGGGPVQEPNVRMADPAPSLRETVQLGTEAPPAAIDPAASRAPGEVAPLSDEVTRALAFIRRSTANAPASSGRLTRKLADRGVPPAAVRLAIRQAQGEGLVDDRVQAAVLADEARDKGHAPRRIRADLRRREFDDEAIEAALARHNDRDPEAAAFAVAAARARSYGGLDAETAFRRLVGYLARRGHNEHLARKVARQVVFVDREADTIAGQ